MRNVGLAAIHRCDWQEYTTVTAECEVPEQLHYIASDRRRALDTMLGPWADRYSDVRLSADVFPRSPSKALVDATGMAGLIVLGAKVYAQGPSGMRVGALAHTVLHYAQCPVIIVPEH